MARWPTWRSHAVASSIGTTTSGGQNCPSKYCQRQESTPRKGIAARSSRILRLPRFFRYHLQERLAIALELAAADAGDLAELGEITRAAADHVHQRRVMEDNIWRHALFARELQSRAAQTLPQRLVGGGERAGFGRGGAAQRPPAAVRGRLDFLAELHRQLAAQHRNAGLAELQPAMTFDVDGEMALRDELAKNGVPFVLLQLGADAERLQPVVAELADALAHLAEEDVDEMGDAEALAGAEHRRERLLRGDDAVPHADRRQAIVAIAAARMVALAEIAEQHLTPAAGRLAEAEQRVELLPLDAALALIDVGAIKQLHQCHDVGHAIGHPGIGGQPVAPGAAGLLIIGLEALRRVEMDDETDIRLVDAHAESDRRDDDDALLLEEAVLMALACRGIEPGMVGQREAPLHGEPVGDLLDLAPGLAVDDAGIAPVFLGEKGEQLRLGILLGDDAIADVRAVEAGGEDTRLAERQTLDDVAPRRPVRGRGEGNARNVGKALVEQRKLEIFRTKIVTPLRDAMRLVDGEERDLGIRQQFEAARRHQPLGRDVDQIELALAHGALDGSRLAGAERRVERRGPHPCLAQRIDLILHQRDQRRNDDAEPGTDERRDLKAQRLAATGRHQHQRIAAGDDVSNDLFLLPAEAVIAEDLAQHAAGAVGSGLDRWLVQQTHHRRPQDPNRTTIAADSISCRPARDRSAGPRLQFLAVAERLIEPSQDVLARAHRRVAAFGVRRAEIARVHRRRKIRIVEGRDREPLPARSIDHAMRRRAEPIIGPARQKIADIDDEGSRNWRRLDPAAGGALAHLEPAIVVLPEQGNAAIIGMRRDAELQLVGLRILRWVVENLGALQRLGITRDKEVFGQAEADRHDLQQVPPAGAVRREIIVEGRLQLRHEGRPVICTAQLLAGAHGGIVRRQFETDAVEFLVVRLLRTIHQRVAERVKPAMIGVGADC